MPTYEYVCDSCGYGFEIFQKMSDKPVSACPKCSKSVRQVLSGGLGINFRGSGFYINDSNSKKNATSEASAKSSKNCSG